MPVAKMWMGSPVTGLLLASCFTAPAWADVENDTATWLAVTSIGKLEALHPKARWWLEGQLRTNEDTSRLFQGILRGALGYATGERGVLWAGYAWVPTNPVGPSNTTYEHRPWQQYTWSTPLPFASATMAVRSRLEERTKEGFTDVGIRFRQMLKFTRPLTEDGHWYLSAWDEFFLAANDTDWGAHAGFDQNRGFLGAGFKPAPQAALEVGYLNQYIARERRPDQIEHILSFTLLLNFQ